MEIWDLVDCHRTPLGLTHPRGLRYPMPKGTYHMAVTVFTVDCDGRLLMTRRAPEKHMYPGYLEITAGSALAGEDSPTAAARELFEETGIDRRGGDGTAPALIFLGTVREPTAFMDCYLAHLDLPAREVPLTMQPGETTETMWVTFRDFEHTIHEGKIPPPVAMRYGVVVDRLREILGDDLWLEQEDLPPACMSEEDGHG